MAPEPAALKSSLNRCYQYERVIQGVRNKTFSRVMELLVQLLPLLALGAQITIEAGGSIYLEAGDGANGTAAQSEIAALQEENSRLRADMTALSEELRHIRERATLNRWLLTKTLTTPEAWVGASPQLDESNHWIRGGSSVCHGLPSHPGSWTRVVWSAHMDAGRSRGFVWEFHDPAHIRVGLRTASENGDARVAFSPYTGEAATIDQHFASHYFYVRPTINATIARGDIFVVDGGYEQPFASSTQSQIHLYCASTSGQYDAVSFRECPPPDVNDYTSPGPWQFYLFVEDQGMHALVRYKVERPDGSTFIDHQGTSPLHYPYRFVVQPYTSGACAHRIASLGGSASWPPSQA